MYLFSVLRVRGLNEIDNIIIYLLIGQLLKIMFSKNDAYFAIRLVECTQWRNVAAINLGCSIHDLYFLFSQINKMNNRKCNKRYT